MASLTANYGWTKPVVGGDTDLWGGELNTDLDGIDATVKTVSNVANAALPSATASTTYVAKAGDTMTGVLTVAPASGYPTINLLKSASGANNQICSYTGSIAISGLRWSVLLGNWEAEGSGNAGSNFQLVNYDNTGSQIGIPLTIYRASGVAVFSSSVTAVNNVIVTSAGYAGITLQKGGSGQGNVIQCQTGTSQRWVLNLGNGTSESGANNGSDITFDSYTDTAGYLATPIAIKRSTGVCTFSAAIVNGPSDRRLKENIAPLEGSLDKVKVLQGVSFNFITTPDKPEIGLIAQDVEPIVPEVIQRFEPRDAEGKSEGERLGIDYPKLTAHLIEAIKTLAARIEALEAARG